MVAAALVAQAGAALFWGGAEAQGGGAMRVAVIGDSDSHSYRDDLAGLRRGGRFHAVSFNYLEIWERLRPGEIDPGAFGLFGDRRLVARAKSWIGAPSKTPRKRDYAYNYAVSGLTCASLGPDWPHQGDWLLAELRSAPAAWRDGLVIIRIGVNDFGQIRHLQRWAEPSGEAEGRRVIEACADAIARLVGRIRAVSTARIALIGAHHDYNRADSHDVWPDLGVLRRLHALLGVYERRLQALAEADPRLAYIDDYSWVRRRFGGRIEGDLRHAFLLDGRVRIVNGIGDDPRNFVMADLHAGTVFGALFLNHLIAGLNEQLGLALTPLSEPEIVALIEPGLPADRARWTEPP